MRSFTYILKRGLLLLLVVNFIYFSAIFLQTREFNFKHVYNNFNYKYVNIGKEDKEPTLNFQNEVENLFKKVEKNEGNKFWLKDTHLTDTEVTVNPNLFFPDSTDPEAWVNKNTLYHDIRLTLSLYLDYIKTQMTQKNGETNGDVEDVGTGDQKVSRDIKADQHGDEYRDTSPVSISVPFNWIDWIDLTALNEELATPVEKRKDCSWVKSNIDKGNNFHFRHLHCTDNQDITAKALKLFGFDRHEQTPGVITDGFSLNRGTIDVRLAQARSFLMTHMPNPYKLMFLNKDKGTYEVNVDQDAPGKRIIKTDLMRNYLVTHDLLKGESRGPNKLKLDPVKEFKSLKESVVPTTLGSLDDIYGVYKTTHDSNEEYSKFLPLPQSAFQYLAQTIDHQLQLYDQLKKLQPLNHIQKSYVTSLELSKARNTRTEDVYFRQATLLPSNIDKKNKDNDKGYHYDWRFFVGTLSTYKGWTQEELVLRQEVILDRLARNWFRFAEEKGLVSWIMHGPLLSWYWDGMMFPFDNDLDIQMPAADLARLGEFYNQTLVIEDIEEGFGKYLIDVGTFVHNRDISLKENHIDARFIDIDTGLYIDITGLSVSDAEIPEEFENDKDLVQISQEGRGTDVYNDRRKHFYKHKQLSPLKYSMLGGVPVFLPFDITNRLMFEYPKGITNLEFHSWYYIPKLRLWVEKARLTAAFDDNDFRKMTNEEKGQVDGEKLHELILDITEEQVLDLLKKDDAILCEFYKTKKFTDVHEKEKGFLFSFQEVTNAEGEKHKSISDKLISGNEHDKYAKFVHDEIKMATPPLRKSFYQFEYVDQPLHHQEFVEKEKSKVKI